MKHPWAFALGAVAIGLVVVGLVLTDPWFLALGLADGALVGAGIVLFNRLVFLNNQCEKAWFNIDVLLKQRHDELPKLVAVCDGQAAFEKDVLERVVRARAAATSATVRSDRVKAEGELTAAVGRLLAVVEQYPDLKTAQAFAQLQGRVSSLETDIADRREFYNDAVMMLNVGVESFPSNVVASWFSIPRREPFRAAPADTEDVKITFKS